MLPSIERDRRVNWDSVSVPTVPRIPTPTRKPSTSSDLLAFAKEATAALHELAQVLAGQAGIKGYCSSLVAKLWAVEERLSQFEDLIETDINKIRRLLYCLEQLSSPIFTSCHRPNFTIQTFQRRLYPKLHALTSQRNQQTNEYIRVLANSNTDRAKKRRSEISKSLNAFAPSEPVQRGPGLRDLATPTESAISADDYLLYLNNLYSTLSAYCFCRELKDDCRINTILRMKNWKKKIGIEDSVNFDLLFLGHPHRNENSDEKCEWHDTCICVALSSQTRLVRWDEMPKLQLQPPPNQIFGTDMAEFVPKENFCSWVGKMHREQCRGVYIASYGQLMHKENELVSSNFLLKFASVPLATLLDKGLLVTSQQKLLLSYLLVKAIWEFYDSAWMTKEWSKHSIHFMFQTDCSFPSQGAQPCDIYVSEPFIEADFASSLSLEPEKSKVPTRSHPYPKILALGIMLLEIELGKHIPEQKGRETESVQNARHIAASRMLFTEEWEKNKNGSFKCIREIIETCIKPDRDKLGTDPDNLRNVLYREVVEPCRKLFSTNWEEDPDTFDIRLEVPRDANSKNRRSRTPQQLSAFPVQNAADDQGQCDLIVQTSRTTLASTTGNRHAAAGPRTGSNATYYGCCFDSASATPSIAGASASGQQWFDWLKDAHEFLELGRKEWTPKDRKSMVKIALLDTGLDMTHPQFKKFLDDKQILDPFDFVEDSIEMKDTDGHGTHGTHLLFKTAPFVKVYPARVFEHSDADANTSSLVAKAIMRAVDVCQVNIISMSFAFENDIMEIQEAIRHATSRNVLVFAAASNNNGNRTNPIGFPARVREHVICINSSSSQNHKSIFSPPGAGWRRNFSVVGEGLEAAWAPTQGLMVRNGTSCATPIGAGIAALVIEYSRQKLSPRIERANDLFTTAGMNKVLYECMTERRTGSEYNYIKPWTLFHSGRDTSEVSMRINKALSEVNL